MSDGAHGKRRRLTPAALLGTGAGSFAAGLLGAVGGWMVYSRFGVNHHMDLPDAIPAPRQLFFSKYAGKISYYVDRTAEGRPLVLIHAINAAASAYEMRPLFDLYRTRRPVLAMDLPGFGFSERGQRAYSPHLYEDAILDLLETQAGAPADVVALSLSGEFAARAAVTRPELFHSLALISPTGFGRPRRAAPETAERSLYRAFAFRLWARPLYDLITTRRSIAYFLQRSFSGPIPPGFVDYAYASAHQPDAEFAPLCFISGILFSPNIARIAYELVETPTLVLYDRDPYTRFDLLPEVMKKNPRVKTVRIPHTRGLPHFEELAETARALEAFWKGAES